MANFCNNCGFPLGASNAFCPKCGSRLAAQPVQPYSAAPTSPVAAANSGSGLKILLVIFGVCAVLGIAAVGAAVYVGHRVKQAVVSKAASYGVDLHSTPQTSAEQPSSAPRRKPCDYISQAEMSRIIGEPVDRAVAQDEACLYYGPPGLASKLGQQSLSTGVTQLEKNQQPQNKQIAEALNNVINGIGAQRGQEVPLIQFVVDPDGKAQMTALDATGAIFGQIPGAKPEEIPGLGDRAVRFANLGLNVLKGTTVIRIVAGPIPNPNEKTVEIARAILPLV
jgi:hypothetical protein